MFSLIQLPILLVMCLFTLDAFALHRPLWEGGFGVGAISTPFYPGSQYRKDYFIPVPFLRFRGRVFRADEDGTRSKLFSNEKSTLDISIAGNVPVPKATDGARKGMPNLDAIGEIGPAYQYRLWQSVNTRQMLQLEIPLRAVISVGDPLFAYQGWRSTPFLYYLNKQYRGATLWRVSASIGPMFGSSSYHDYFYQVQPQYVTSNRNLYNAKAGYSGSRVTFTLSSNRRDSFVGLFYTYHNLNKAVFNDSPLVEKNSYSVIGIAAVWVFSHSSQGATHDE